MNPRAATWMWLAQRGSAAVLALCVIVHLAVIILAVRGGLSAAEILGRTRGSVGWAAFYGLFVVAVAIHAPIGLRSIVREHSWWRGRSLDVAAIIVGIGLLFLGLRAVAAVT